MRKGPVLTTIGDLGPGDIFTIGFDGADQWKIICTNMHFANLKFYGAQAVPIAGNKKAKAFRKNLQVVYIKKETLNPYTFQGLQ